jgi:uncharacterized UBP type Zn finger protein
MSTQADRNASSPSLGQMIGNEIRRITFQRSPARRACEHPLDSTSPDAGPASCLGCVRDSTTPVKLRMCLTCGSIGCCDSSAGRHAAGHYAETGHPTMRSIEPGDSWGWCYVNEAYLSLVTR